MNANNGVSYTYNPDGSRKTATRVTGGVSVTTTYAYYPNGGFRQGQLQSVTNNVGTLTYDYDAAGNKISMQPPSLVASGKRILYGYDALNRLVSVLHPDAALTTFGYDKAGNRQSVTRKSAAGAIFSSTNYVYDALNRLTDQMNISGTGASVSAYHYTLRPDGKRQFVTESGSGTSNSQTTYTYDNAGKLTQESGAYGTIAYTYDNVGNRLTKTVSGAATGNGQTTSTYDANDRLTSGGHSYDFDGNELSVNGQAASYDFENHLVALSGGTTYTYDADGSRVGVTTGSTTTSYLVDSSLPYASVVEEYTNGTLSARYDYGDDLVRMDRAGGIYYYLYDGLGSTRQLVNTGGTVTDGYFYDAFGEGTSHSPSSGVVNPFLFNAQQFDTASNDYYLRARYYDQSNGRFISQDPYSGSNDDPITLHRYLYASCDPVDRVDPSGQDTEEETIVATGGAATLSATLNSVVFNVGLVAGRAVVFAGEHAIEIEFYSALGLTLTTFAHQALGKVLANNESLVPDHPNAPNVYGDFLDKITDANRSNYQGLDDFRDGYATENKVYANFSGGEFKTKLLSRIRKDAVQLRETDAFKPKNEPRYEGLPTYTTNNSDPNLNVRAKAIFGAIPENMASLLNDPDVLAEVDQIYQDTDVEVTLAPLRGLQR